MYQFTRYHSTIVRYIFFCIVILPLIKLTSIYYYDLPEQSTIEIHSSGLANEFNEKNSMNISEQVTLKYARENVRKINNKQLMYNKHLFSSNHTRYILLVQVHTRIVYLQKFIQMLADLETIEQTLIVFSHDFIDLNINMLIRNITFAPVRKMTGKIFF